MITPPPGSRITVTLPQEDNVITLPAAANPSRYFIAAFLLFWLGGWLIGELSVLGVLLAGVFHLVTFQPSNDSAAGVGGLFMLFWLGGWTIGGIFVIRFFILLVAPAQLERITLATGQIFYQEPSYSPDFFRFNYSQPRNFNFYKKMLKKPRRLIFTPEEAKTLTLRNQGEQRLTIDQGIERLSLAEQATEIEREWLYGVLIAWRNGKE